MSSAVYKAEKNNEARDRAIASLNGSGPTLLKQRLRADPDFIRLSRLAAKPKFCFEEHEYWKTSAMKLEEKGYPDDMVREVLIEIHGPYFPAGNAPRPHVKTAKRR